MWFCVGFVALRKILYDVVCVRTNNPLQCLCRHKQRHKNINSQNPTIFLYFLCNQISLFCVEFSKALLHKTLPCGKYINF